MEREEMFNILENFGISEDFISGAICMGGYNKETAERILYYCFGYSSFEQFLEENEEE